MTCLVTKHLNFYNRKVNKLLCQSLKVLEPDEGPHFKPGVPMCQDLRYEVIEMAGMLPISEISQRFGIQRSTAHKYVKQYRETGNIGTLSRKHIRAPIELSFAVSLHLM